MAGIRFEPAKTISIESAGDLTMVTIEVSSYKAFLLYSPYQADQLTNVRISKSCPKPEHDMIIRECYEDETFLYESGNDEESGADDDQPPPPPGGGDSSETNRKKAEKGKMVQREKRQTKGSLG